MAKKSTRPDQVLKATQEQLPVAKELAVSTDALTQVASQLRDAAAQMTLGLQTLQQALEGMAPKVTVGGAATVAAQINTWDDDPFSQAVATQDPVDATPIQVGIPVNNNPLLQTQVDGPSPVPSIYAPGTTEFRYWTAAESLARAVNFWAQWLPAGTRWTVMQAPMRVNLVAGTDLNANYSRRFGLRFYQDTVRGRQVFSGESPDVSCHELGHAILDAFRPELFDAASTEAAAFHESFGDMSAILSALQLDSLCEKVIRETGGRLNVNSRLSRLAEQLGWAIRQRSPTAADQDCLRNAANRFFYQSPDTLPTTAPASQLSSEVHSFSRIFTGAFLDALARMLDVVGPATTNNLRMVSGHLGQLLVDAVRLAPITAAYYSQVAASMVQADQQRFVGRYRASLTSGFVEHGILAPSAVVALRNAQVPRPVQQQAMAGTAISPSGPTLLTLGGESDGYLRAAHEAPQLPIRSLQTDYLTLEVHVPSETPRYSVASASLGIGPALEPTAEQAARGFVEDLIRRDRIDFEPAQSVVAAALITSQARVKKTHTVAVTEDNKVRLKRMHFNCWCNLCSLGDNGSMKAC